MGFGLNMKDLVVVSNGEIWWKLKTKTQGGYT